MFYLKLKPPVEYLMKISVFFKICDKKVPIAKDKHSLFFIRKPEEFNSKKPVIRTYVDIN